MGTQPARETRVPGEPVGSARDGLGRWVPTLRTKASWQDHLGWGHSSRQTALGTESNTPGDSLFNVFLNIFLHEANKVMFVTPIFWKRSLRSEDHTVCLMSHIYLSPKPMSFQCHHRPLQKPQRDEDITAGSGTTQHLQTRTKM